MAQVYSFRQTSNQTFKVMYKHIHLVMPLKKHKNASLSTLQKHLMDSSTLDVSVKQI